MDNFRSFLIWQLIAPFMFVRVYGYLSYFAFFEQHVLLTYIGLSLIFITLLLIFGFFTLGVHPNNFLG